MRFYLLGPRVFGTRPGLSFSPRDLRGLAADAHGHWRGGFVYVVQNGDGQHCKVGITTNPVARLAQLQTGSAHPLRFAFLAAAATEPREIEAAAHGFLARCRRSGEWFECEAAAAIGAVYFAASSTRQPIVAVDHLRPEEAPALAAQAFALAVHRKPVLAMAAQTVFLAALAIWCGQIDPSPAADYLGILTAWTILMSLMWKCG